MPLSLYSEVVQPTGSLAGSGAVKVLGRPKLSTLGLVLRESIQNSWDARKDARQVRFTIERRQLTAKEVRVLSEQIFPEAKAVSVPMVEALRRRPEIIVLTDMGTVGLEGPVRADRVEDRKPQRFVNFFRNIGSHQEVAGSGGTYGFGKSSLYRLSKSKAIAVFTRARPTPGAALESRFMAAAIGKSMRRESRWLTGRHWWGAPGTRRDPVVDPLVDAEAVKVAKSLNLHFSHNEAGTSIAIMSPDIDNEADFRTEVVETLVYNFWPKMLSTAEAGPDIYFSFIDKGDDVKIPVPRDHPKVGPFVSAYSALKRSTRAVTSSVVKVSSRGEEVSVGRVAYVRAPVVQDTGEKRKKWEPFGNVIHHVCLLRTPELVVKYEKTQPPIGSQSGYAAVFRAADQHNDTFANAEPPAHDDWEPASLGRRDKEVVNRTLKGLRQLMRRVADAGSGVAAGAGSGLPLGRLASFLGELLDGVEADGPQVFSTGVARPLGGSSGRSAAKVRIEVTGTQIAESNRQQAGVFAQISVTLRGARPGARVRIRAEGGVQTADGIETEAPENAPSVEVLSWRDERGAEIAVGSEVIVKAQVRPLMLSVVAVVPERLLGALSFSCTSEGPE